MGAKGRPNLSERTIAAILRDARAGMTFTKIARKYNRGTSTIRIHVRRAGMPPRPGNHKPLKVTPEIAKAIADAWEAGEKASVTVARLGLARSTVRDYRIKMGLPPRLKKIDRRDPELVRGVAEAWAAGEKAIVICARFNVCRSTVRRYSLLMGLPLRHFRNGYRYAAPQT